MSPEKAAYVKAKRDKWRLQGRCTAHGAEKPCAKCAGQITKMRASTGDKRSEFCMECICGGGKHRRECSRWGKS